MKLSQPATKTTMPLVDYSSDSSSSPPPKRAKTSETASRRAPLLPPLPRAFHDLYASTVRASPADAPSLHHGRRRQTPHVAGHWPSHVYLSWLPSETQQAVLGRLIALAAATLPQETSQAPALHSFLKDDLDVPLPLHVSLSRPLVLTSANKDAFLARAVRAIRRAGAVPFAIAPRGLAWYHSPDSNRTFLVLRVAVVDPEPGDNNDNDNELSWLLARCNAVAGAFGQPELYAAPTDQDQDQDRERTTDAFHASIAWTLGNPTSRESGLDDSQVGQLLLAGGEDPDVDDDEIRGITDWRIDVDSVKIKIGNVVTSVDI